MDVIAPWKAHNAATLARFVNEKAIVELERKGAPDLARFRIQEPTFELLDRDSSELSCSDAASVCCLGGWVVGFGYRDTDVGRFDFRFSSGFDVTRICRSIEVDGKRYALVVFVTNRQAGKQIVTGSSGSASASQLGFVYTLSETCDTYVLAGVSVSVD
jgi:hypothetical protein